MNYKLGLFLVLIVISCNNSMLLKEREVLERKVEAFLFLSKYHHQLHIMIGEEEGDIKNAFQDFSNGIRKVENNELIPVINAISRIQSVDPESENVKRLDYLVDYYQSGLSLQIEAIMRSYGYFESFSFESAIDIYDRINNNL